MASKCANCGARLSCGCQRRAASNGSSACSGCVNALNEKLAAAQLAVKQVRETPTTDQTVWRANRYKKD